MRCEGKSYLNTVKRMIMNVLLYQALLTQKAALETVAAPRVGLSLVTNAADDTVFRFTANYLVKEILPERKPRTDLVLCMS